MNIVSAADNQIFLATDDLQASLFVQDPQVPTHEPARAIEGAFGRRLIVEVA